MIITESKLRKIIRDILLERTIGPHTKKIRAAASSLGILPPSPGRHYNDPDDPVRNIIKAYSSLTEEEKDWWHGWYEHAHEDMKEIKDNVKNETGVDVPLNVVCAVTAIFSPGCEWERNILGAQSYLIWKLTGGEGESPFKPVYSQKENLAKADNAIKTMESGEDPSIFATGPKVAPFYKSLLDPKGTKDLLVADRHVLNLWRGHRVEDKNTIGKKLRERIIDDFKKASQEIYKNTGKLVPLQDLQAATWFVWQHLD